MADAMLLLRLEHENIAKLLRVLDEQLLALGAGEPPDYPLLQSSLQYLRDYPEQCHHPKEDLVFRQLSRRDPTAAGGIVNLVQEHEELARLTGRFIDLVKGTVESPDVSIEQLEHTMRHFVDYYRHHMSMEEKHFFPMALQALTQDDWDEIDFSLFDRDDPVFDKATEERFKTLRSEISSLAQEQRKRVATAVLLHQDAGRLGRLTSVAQFNDVMKNAETEIRLIRSPEGRYVLEKEDHAVMGIPECSEARAIWCAYYFLKGRNVHIRLSSDA